MDYNFRKIEQEWQEKWKKDNAYKVSSPGSGETPKPKYYVLDMFPYPSGAGLHVGHPLGYISSDIYARYKRLKGYNVLHPMGYDAFGLPAEQYAIEHGVHPAVSTDQNIKNFRGQLDNIGFSFDWDREVKTSDPHYYKWTQWIFLQLFGSWYNRPKKSADSIENLVAIFEKEGNTTHLCPGDKSISFTAAEWKAFDENRRQDILMEYRLSFCGYGEVNWCEALGTVLANDEVVNGVSERGGYPVEKKRLRQWYLRITEYADRLLEGLEKVEFSESMKEMQTNWIGKSYGAEIDFRLTPNPSPSGEGSLDSESSSNKHFQTANLKSWDTLKEFGRDNRREPTEAENILWQKLRNNQLGHKVRRQHAIDSFIVDFAFLEKNILIEIDGGYHEENEQKEYDISRSEYLREKGYTELRFTNEEVINNTEAVINTIQSALSGSTPLSARRGDGGEAILKVYTTRPDTIFGVDFMVIAPEHELIESITSPEQKQAVEEYIAYVKSRSERERMAEKKITGCFTGAYALNPFNDHKIPVWISEYVLAGYGTGAIMAVPCGDERDHKFAQHFNIPITNIIGSYYNGEEANPTKDAKLENSGFLNGMIMRDAIAVVNNKLEEMGIGKKQVNYRMRDAAFSRQRYWGEPFPIVWKDGIAHPLPEGQLPVLLPHMDELKPGPDAEGPLANLDEWKHFNGGIREVNTMPGYAGSSWYFLRYMDPHNDTEFCNRKISDYWGQVDLYIGGTEHAVGHLLYSRMWTKVLFDLGHIGFDEPFKKLLNQGMIQGSSRLVYRIRRENKFISHGKKDETEDVKVFEEPKGKDFFTRKRGIRPMSKYEYDPIHVDVNIVDGVDLDIEAFREWRPEYADATFILENGDELEAKAPLSTGGEGPGVRYVCGVEVEKMSKRLYNTVNPDDLVLKFGADTFRMYEMFLGPVEASKPWDTKGIEGVHRFLRKLWRLFYDEVKGKVWNNDKATDAELKVLHKAIRKIEEDTEKFAFNTAVSTFMICVNDLADLKCNKKEILDQLLVLLTPYAPHIAEELWHLTGNTTSILDASFPVFNAKYVTETSKEYPVSINGKTRTTINIALDAAQPEVEQIVLNNEIVQKWLEGKSPKKIIFVKGKMVNVVI